MNLVCGVIEPGLHSTWPRSTSSRLVPRSRTPTLSPAWPWSSSLRNISTPVHTVFWCRTDADDLDFLAHLDHPPLDPARHHRAAARDREHVLHRHQERQVHRPLRLRNILIHRLHQLQNRLLPDLRIAVLQRRQRRTLDDRHVVAREAVRTTVARGPPSPPTRAAPGRPPGRTLFRYTTSAGTPDLARQQDVLAGLRHRAVGRRHHQDRPVHLRRPGDHVLHIVRVPGAVDVRVVTVRRLVLHVRRGDRDRRAPSPPAPCRSRRTP